jgi:O-antigen/teichoic acid export membrane protein
MTPENERRQIARNASSSYALRVLLALSALLLTPYLYRRLGADGFGTWSVMFTLTTIFSLLEIGFSAGTVKFVAEYRAQEKTRDLQDTVGVALTLMAVLGLAALAVSAAAAFLFSELAAASERDDFRAGMLVLGAAMLVRFPCVAFGATLNGYQRYDLSNLAAAVTTVGLAAGAVAAVEAGTGVLGIAVAHAAALVAGGLLYAVLLVRVAPGLRLVPRLGDGATRRRIGAFSSFSLLADTAIFIGQRMDVILIAAIRNAAAAAPFAAAVKLQSGLQSLTGPFVDLLMPMVSDLWARGNRDEVIRRFLIGTRIALQLTLPVSVGLALFARDIVDVWLGPTAPDVTVAIIVILLSFQVLAVAATPAAKILVGIGRVRLVGALAVFEGLLNVGATIVLVYAYGAVGAAIGSLVAVTLFAPIMFPLACRATGCPAARLLRFAIAPGVASALPAIAAMLAVRVLAPAGPARLALGLALGGAVFTVIAARQVGIRPLIATLRTRGAVPSASDSASTL